MPDLPKDLREKYLLENNGLDEEEELEEFYDREVLHWVKLAFASGLKHSTSGKLNYQNGFNEGLKAGREEEREDVDNRLRRVIKNHGAIGLDGKMYGLREAKKIVVVNTGEVIDLSPNQNTKE